MQIRTFATSSLFLLLHGVIGPSAHPGEYYKCVGAKGQIYLSNVACPSQSEKIESNQFRDVSDREYQEARRREEEAKRLEQARQDVEKARQEAKAQQERARELALELVHARNQCLIEADKNYQTRWDETCRSYGQLKGCLLNSLIANGYDRSRTEERNECYQRYPLR